MTLLAGDVGGTKTVLALVEDRAVRRRVVYPSAQFSSLASMVQSFLGGERVSLSRACFGIAGPVFDDACRTTNLPWTVEARDLERVLGIPRVQLVNDFYALAIGITELPDTDLCPLHGAPSDPRGPWVVLGAGTGLGEAVVVRSERGFEVLASEGGHCDFAPRTEKEIELLRFLMRRFNGHVSYERIVSGPGLVSVYHFVRERQPERESPLVRAELESKPDPASVISSHALEGDDPLCAEALDLFAAVYGAEAGNLALKVVPRGGVFVAGGIAPKILPKLQDGTFLRAFLDKGRLSHLLQSTPLKVVLNPDAGLVGAAAIAARPG